MKIRKIVIESLLAVVWLLALAAFAFAYATALIGGGMFAFGEACVLAFGTVALVLWAKISHPPEIVEQLLYRTEHPRA